MLRIILTGLFIYVLQAAYAIDPAKEYILTPDSIGWNYTSFNIKSGQFQIANWVYKPNTHTDKKTVLILALPDAGNQSYFVYHAATLANAGYTVVTFDYRGFGRSSDFEIDRNQLYYTEFSEDLMAVVAVVAKEFKGKQIGIFGMSMGTTITNRIIYKLQKKIDFYIADGLVVDTDVIVSRWNQNNQKLTLPESSKSYTRALAKLALPVMIFCASTDVITTCDDISQLRSMHAHASVQAYEGDHLTVFQSGDDGFGQFVISYIDELVSRLVGH